MKDSRVDFYFFNARTVELFQCSYDTCFFARTRGPIDEEMWKVAALGLEEGLGRGDLEGEGCIREILDAPRDHDDRLIDRETVGGVCLRGEPLCRS